MRDPKFIDGQKVILKSGGPQMTIARVNMKPDPLSPTLRSFKGTYMCVWFVGTEMKREQFNEDALELIH